MSMYPALYAALPRLKCPPLTNEWLPTSVQMDALLSPLSAQEKSSLLKADALLSHRRLNIANQESKKQLDETPQPVPKLLDQLQQIFECAWLFNTHICTDTPFASLVEQLQHPNLLEAVLRHAAAPYLNLQFEQPWIVDYVRALQTNSDAQAEHIVIRALWQVCEQATVGDIHFSSVLARYVQWRICDQRQAQPNQQVALLQSLLNHATSYLQAQYTESIHVADQ